MALGKKKAKQISFWVETIQLQAHMQHPFYRLSATSKGSIRSAASPTRVSDLLCLREFSGLSLEERTPDHSTPSQTRRLMNLGTH